MFVYVFISERVKDDLYPQAVRNGEQGNNNLSLGVPVREIILNYFT